MKIRSITYFMDPGWPIDQAALTKAGGFIRAAQKAYEEVGYEVQTTRMATIPFPHLAGTLKTTEIVNMAKTLETSSADQGFAYISLGPALPDAPESYPVIIDALAATENVFFSAVLASKSSGISLPAIRACADVIHRAALLEPDGFANLRFAALAGVAPGAPFFPAAYHEAGPPSFAIATESASLAVEAFSTAKSLNNGIENLIAAVEKHGRALGKAGESLVKQFNIPFGGIDFSLAPFPEEASSLGTAIERIGVPGVGMHGSLAAAAIMADALDRADFPRVGFSGLFLPLLEDETLAKRAVEEKLTIKDLLMYSAVCGTGIDTIPLPGDTTSDQIAALLLDLAALSQRLEKPLTARLMPIPGKTAGEMTTFDFPFFTNSRVMELTAEPLQGHLLGDESFHLRWRK
ncbi:MAG: DUF711 family protein [Chloroflexi bacterium]|nr:DUF711 family protein [Chloroflexota bacterium]